MNINRLKLFSYAYLIAPVVIFSLGWLKPIYSIPITLMLIYIFLKIYKQCREENSEEKILSNNGILLLFFSITLLCILGGHGGFFYQTGDWNERNAIFRDLINYKWPVYYKATDNALTYYIGQWMVPAFFSKILQFILGIFMGSSVIINSDICFYIGNVFLLYWNSIGVLLACLWLLKILKINGKKSIIAIVLFLGFSGLDILGFLGTRAMPTPYHLEWWAKRYQYSSMITQLYWVFNQCIGIWIITLMFLEEKRVNNYMLLILLSIPFSPLGTVGLAILFLARAIKYLIESIKNKKFKEFLKDVFSIQNIFALISIFPVHLLYYLSNASVQGSSTGGGFNILWKYFDSWKDLGKFAIFFMLEIGIYMIFTFSKHKKDSLFYVVLISLIVIPFFQLGYAFDFSMRVSIPPLVVITVWMIECFFEKINKKRITFGLVCLCLVVLMGSVTPAIEIYRGFYYAFEKKKIANVCDRIKTFTNDEKSSNFLTNDPKENSIFYKYIAK